MSIKNIGFIGLGAMGAPMATQIVTKGFPLFVYDLSEEAMKPLVEAGATACCSPADVASRVDAVCTIVPDSPEVEAVILGPGGVLEGAREGLIVIEMSTIDPAVTKSVAKRVLDAGLRMIDAPVCRSTDHAARGEIEILVGGSKEDYDACMPLLECMGNTFFYCGDTGAGIMMKLVNNMMGQAIGLAVCEGLSLGVKAGLDRDLIIEVLSGTAVSNKFMEDVYPNAALKGNFDLGFALDWAHKDVGHALRTAARLGTPCPAASMAHLFQNIARGKGKGRWDHTALATVFEEMANVKLCDDAQ